MGEGVSVDIQVLATSVDLTSPGLGLLKASEASGLELLDTLGDGVEGRGRRIDVLEEARGGRGDGGGLGKAGWDGTWRDGTGRDGATQSS